MKHEQKPPQAKNMGKHKRRKESKVSKRYAEQLEKEGQEEEIRLLRERYTTNKLLLIKAWVAVDWMVTDMKQKADSSDLNPGVYSKQLTEAIELKKELDEWAASKGLQLCDYWN